MPYPLVIRQPLDEEQNKLHCEARWIAAILKANTHHMPKTAGRLEEWRTPFQTAGHPLDIRTHQQRKVDLR